MQCDVTTKKKSPGSAHREKVCLGKDGVEMFIARLYRASNGHFGANQMRR
jgi:hypothetical protein